ncbi:MAG: YdcF family protein [Ferruginibacter sp.]|nr:YdcF family protein [Ferruginibacter sp.]
MPFTRFVSSSKNKWSWLFLKGFLLSIIFNSCSFSGKSTKRLYESYRQKIFDVVIVPGVPFRNGTWDKTMKGRVYWAKYLYDQGITKNILFSGSAVYTPYYEAIIMQLYAIELGVPREHIFFETRAEHSTENVYYSYEKARELGFKNMGLAYDPFQSKLLNRFIRKQFNGEVAVLPMVMDTMKALEPIMIDPVINAREAYYKDFVSIKKRESFFKRLKGTVGYNIKYRSKQSE